MKMPNSSDVDAAVVGSFSRSAVNARYKAACVDVHKHTRRADGRERKNEITHVQMHMCGSMRV